MNFLKAYHVSSFKHENPIISFNNPRLNEPLFITQLKKGVGVIYDFQTKPHPMMFILAAMFNLRVESPHCLGTK